MCSYFSSSWENGILLNKLFTLGGRLLNQPRGKHVPKRAKSHRCAVDALGKFACNFSTFFKVSHREFFLENRLQNLNGLTDLARKNSKNN